ncbi:MAG: aspartate kinase [Candidatus Dormibacteraceae bacterium]
MTEGAPVLVQKYGGTSVGTAARIRHVSQRIADTVRAGKQVVAVVSAMGKTTDRLIALAAQVSDDPPLRELDMLVANGETITAPLVAMCLQGLGVPATSLSGMQAGVHTSHHHFKARIREVDATRLRRMLRQGIVPVVAGFQGITEDLDIATLGRGGSDTTAVALAAALDAEACEILTDVDGFLTADPRVVPGARLLPSIAYDECIELASVGAKVMHPRAVEIGELYQMPIHVRSSFHRRRGTMIVSEVPMEDRNRVRGVAHQKGVAKVTILGVPDRPGLAASLMEPLSDAGISIDVIVQNVSSHGETDLTFTCDDADIKVAEPLAREAASAMGAKGVQVASGAAKVSIVGSGMLGTPGIAARMFRTLASVGANIEMISTAEIRITCVIQQAKAEEAVRALHQAFQLDQDRLMTTG